MCPTAVLTDEKISDTEFEISIDAKHICSFKLNKELYEALERAWRENGFKNRSDFIRALVKKAYEKGLRVEGDGFSPHIAGPLNKVVTLKVDHGLREIIQQLVEDNGLSNKSDLMRLLLLEYVNGKIVL